MKLFQPFMIIGQCNSIWKHCPKKLSGFFKSLFIGYFTFFLVFSPTLSSLAEERNVPGLKQNKKLIEPISRKVTKTKEKIKKRMPSYTRLMRASNDLLEKQNNGFNAGKAVEKNELINDFNRFIDSEKKTT